MPYVDGKTGFWLLAVVVYDDVCGKQAIECWMQARAQKQEVKRGTTQQTRQDEGVRCTLRGTSCTTIIFSDASTIDYEWLARIRKDDGGGEAGDGCVALESTLC